MSWERLACGSLKQGERLCSCSIARACRALFTCKGLLAMAHHGMLVHVTWAATDCQLHAHQFSVDHLSVASGEMPISEVLSFIWMLLNRNPLR